MNKKEKEAIELLESLEPDDLIECAIYRNALETVLNLIDKQNKVIKEYETLLKRQEKLEQEKDILKKQGWL